MKWIRHLSSRRKLYGELSEEIQAHLEEKVDELVAGGMSRHEAAAAARREFGNVTLIEERGRDVWRWPSLDDFLMDVRFGVRMLRRNPAFAAVALLTLALGIGANTAIFSVLDAVLLRSLPVSDPGQLVLLTDPDSHGHSFGDESGDRSLLSYSEFEYLRDHTDVFSGIFAADSALQEVTWGAGYAASGEAQEGETARVRLVSGDYFPTLGVKAAAGRTFTSEVDRARGAAPVAVLSYSFWKERLGLHPAVVGMTIRIRRAPFEVVGVAPPGFFGETVGEAPDIWIPMTMQEAVYPGRDLLSMAPGMLNQHIWLQVMARLRPGISAGQAGAQVNIVFKHLLESEVASTLTADQRRGFFDQQIKIRPGGRGSSTLHDAFADPIKLLMCLVVLILLIACANIANLLLARGALRQREFAVRLAVGGGRLRLITQLLTESLLLAFLGAALGVALAQWTDRVLLRAVSGVSSGPKSVQLNLQPDMRILGFTMAVAVLASLIFGLVPALRAAGTDISPVLKVTTSRSTGGFHRRRLPAGKLLVIAQLGISLILLVAAGLFVDSFARLGAVGLGYSSEHLLLFRVDAAIAGYKGPSILTLYQSLLDTLSMLPGVRTATLSSNGLFQDSESGDPIAVEGYAPRPGEEMHSRFDHIGPGYFSTVGIPVLIGREIGPRDGGTCPRV
ncbi:MAG TPA: ABC transporter permease, partial [Acidobacteriota bacterium]|nr:ABC transporter permease [Acidobacteriota bacterium]